MEIFPAIISFIKESSYTEFMVVTVVVSFVSVYSLKYFMDIQKKLNNVDDLNSEKKEGSEDKYFEDLLKHYEELSIDAKHRQQISTSVVMFEELADRIRFSRTRLRNNLKTLTMHAVVNLVLAILIVLCTMLILMYMLAVEFKGTEPSISFIASRFILLTFVQFTTFMFMRMYRSLMSDIKFIVNEITNVEQKFIALHTACIFNNEKAVGDVLLSMANCERNFILKKGETTAEIERDRVSQTGDQSLLDFIRRGKSRK